MKKIVAELSELYKGVSSVLPEGADAICQELIIMGTLSQISRKLDVRDYIINVLKSTIGTAAVKQQNLDMQKPRWRISINVYTWKHKNFKKALSRFIEMV